MLGTDEYYSNSLKSHILNNLVSKKKYTLEQIYKILLADIESQITEQKEKDQFIKNLDNAFKYINQDIFGMEE